MPDIQITGDKHPCPFGKEYEKFQIEGIDFLSARAGAILGDDMGSGKTIMAIGGVNAVSEIVKVLVICPAQVKIHWSRELEGWLTKPLAIQVVHAGDNWNYDKEVYIINYEILRRYRRELRRRTWDALIIDEAHHLGDPGSQRTREVFGFAYGPVPIPARRCWELTGTAMDGRPIKLWTLLNAVAPGAFKTYHEFGMEYCNAHEIDVPVIRKDKDGNVSRTYTTIWNYQGTGNPTIIKGLREKMKPYCLRRTKKQIMPFLPKVTRRLLEVRIKGQNRILVREEKTFQEAIRLLQEGSRVEFEYMATARKEVALSKMHINFQIVKDALLQKAKVLAFGFHRESLKDLHQRLLHDGAVIIIGGMTSKKRQEAIDRFQRDPLTRVFIGNYDAAGEGITLTNTDYMVILEPDFRPKAFSQVESRAHRMGLKNPLLVDYVAVENSMDARIYRKMLQKQGNTDLVLDGPGYDHWTQWL